MGRACIKKREMFAEHSTKQ